MHRAGDVVLAGFGAVVMQAQVDAGGGLEALLERGGMAGLSLALIWWLLSRFTKQLDALTELANRQAQIIAELKETVRSLASSMEAHVEADKAGRRE